MRRRRTNCIVSCSPKGRLQRLGARELENMVVKNAQNEVRNLRDVSHQWNRLMMLGRDAEHCGYLKTARELYRQAMDLCVMVDDALTDFRFAAKARDAAQASDRVWHMMGGEGSPAMRSANLSYEEIYYTI